MYLVETTPIGKDRLPLADLRGHLRLGTGFSDDTVQDDLLERILRGALTEVETLTAKALLHREFVLRLDAWTGTAHHLLPRAPVTGIGGVSIAYRDGTRELVSRDRYRMRRDPVRPALVSSGYLMPSIPTGGEAEVVFTAGFGQAWSEVPQDLALAVVSLASARYEDRQGDRGLPDGVRALLSPYRPIRLARSV